MRNDYLLAVSTGHVTLQRSQGISIHYTQRLKNYKRVMTIT